MYRDTELVESSKGTRHSCLQLQHTILTTHIMPKGVAAIIHGAEQTIAVEVHRLMAA